MTVTRVPGLHLLPLLALRAEATNNAYRDHLKVCQLDICPEALAICRDADLAASVYGFEFQRQQSAPVRAAAK